MTPPAEAPGHARPTRPTDRGTALVTGASGYIGSRLVPALLGDGWRVRVLTRSADGLDRFDWAAQVQVTEGSASEPGTLDDALSGVDVAYYLIHSMDGEGDFVSRDRELAAGFGAACDRTGVGRLVYLSGLYPEGEELSAHLGSRREVEQVLLGGATPTVVLRAAVILGSGSASFEMLRHLTERLPAMIGPTWLDHRIQPISIHDVLHYLVAVAALPEQLNRGFDLGGPDVLTYREMIQRFARVAGLPPRLVRTVPSVITPWLASHWVGLVTPVPTGLAKPLVGSLVHEVVCSEHDIASYVPDPPEGLRGFEAAVAESLVVHEPGEAPGAPATSADSDASWAGPTVHTDHYASRVQSDVEDVWAAVRAESREGLAGRAGLWQEHRVEPPHRLVLRSRATLTGRSELTFEVTADGPGHSRLSLRTEHRPRGFLGRLGWPVSLPLRVLGQLVTHRAVRRRAQDRAPG